MLDVGRSNPLENFGYRDLALPIDGGQVIEDQPDWAQIRYRRRQSKRILKGWADGLSCSGWHIASSGRRGPDAQLWLTRAADPGVLVLTATDIGGQVDLHVRHLQRQTRLDPWLPASLSDAPLMPLDSELFRLEVDETSDGRQVLHAAYPASLDTQTVIDTWTLALKSRGWTAEPDDGPKAGTFSGPDGRVTLVVWRAIGAIEINLHHVVAEDPFYKLWNSNNLPLFGAPDSAFQNVTPNTQELKTIVRCGDVHAGTQEPIELLKMYDADLTKRGWKRVNGALAKGRDAVYRDADQQVIVHLSRRAYCQAVYLIVRAGVPRSAMAPRWAGDEWAEIVGKAGIVIGATHTDPKAEQRAYLVVEVRADLFGLAPTAADPCAQLNQKLKDHWSRVLHRRGWRSDGYEQGFAFARGEETIDVDLSCELGVATLTFLR